MRAPALLGQRRRSPAGAREPPRAPPVTLRPGRSARARGRDHSLPSEGSGASFRLDHGADRSVPGGAGRGRHHGGSGGAHAVGARNRHKGGGAGQAADGRPRGPRHRGRCADEGAGGGGRAPGRGRAKRRRRSLHRQGQRESRRPRDPDGRRAARAQGVPSGHRGRGSGRRPQEAGRQRPLRQRRVRKAAEAAGRPRGGGSVLDGWCRGARARAARSARRRHRTTCRAATAAGRRRAHGRSLVANADLRPPRRDEPAARLAARRVLGQATGPRHGHRRRWSRQVAPVRGARRGVETVEPRCERRRAARARAGRRRRRREPESVAGALLRDSGREARRSRRGPARRARARAVAGGGADPRLDDPGRTGATHARCRARRAAGDRQPQCRPGPPAARARAAARLDPRRRPLRRRRDSGSARVRDDARSRGAALGLHRRAPGAGPDEADVGRPERGAPAPGSGSARPRQRRPSWLGDCCSPSNTFRARPSTRWSRVPTAIRSCSPS